MRRRTEKKKKGQRKFGKEEKTLIALSIYSQFTQSILIQKKEKKLKEERLIKIWKKEQRIKKEKRGRSSSNKGNPK